MCGGRGRARDMKGGVIGGVWEVWGGLCGGGDCALCIG